MRSVSGKPKRGDEAGPGALALDQGVRGLRRAMAEAVGAREQLVERQPALLRGKLERGEDTFLERVRRCRGLGGQDGAAAIHDSDVGERPAGIDAKVERSPDDRGGCFGVCSEVSAAFTQRATYR